MNALRFCSIRAAVLSLALCSSAAGVLAAPGLSVVALGNSITRHGPAPAINWTGDWGMAASSAQTDYVSQLTRLLNEGHYPVATTKVFNLTPLERDPKDFKPGVELFSASSASDLLVVELGDNVRKSSMADFALAYPQLLAQARPAKGVLVCLSTWWSSTAADALIEPACARAGGVYVAIGDLHGKPGTKGSPSQGLTDPGVLNHPGDLGMAEIAARIYAAWREQQTKR